ncbi:MAG: dihydrofolate reductase [Planctomycetes bacterium]|nr:dihydrofolate reductase [Planctomycetota bacterium]
MLSVIVAMSENRLIGRGGDLPWHLSADLRRFRRLTTGHAIIMGRKTYESIGRPLLERRSIVITRQADYMAEGIETAGSFNAALALVAGDEEAFVIGGAEVFREALPRAGRLYLTLVHAELEGDVYLPPFDKDEWTLTSEERNAADERNDFDYSFLVYERRVAGG